MQKKFFKGIFNFNRELFIEYAYAHSKQQAFIVFCRRIAKKQSVIPSWVFNHFKEHENGYEITIEPRKETIHEKA